MMADQKGNQQNQGKNQGGQQQAGQNQGTGERPGNNGEQDRGKRSVNDPGAARSDPRQNLR
jgi:hypothetical protein